MKFALTISNMENLYVAFDEAGDGKEKDLLGHYPTTREHLKRNHRVNRYFFS